MQIFRASAASATTMRAMSGAYQALIEATIEHLHDLKRRGVRFVEIDSDTLRDLSQPSSSPPPKPRPTAPVEPAISTQIRAALETEPRVENTSSPPSASGTDKARAMDELRERALACVKCPHLASSRRNVVFGVGDINAQLIFVGEGPGVDEDLKGEPFVGKAGELLTKIIRAMDLSRERVYIANVLKCRPDTPGQTSGNRKPTPEEMRTCIPYLHAQIELIQPKAMVALGGTALEGLLGNVGGITRLRGKWQTYRGIPLMPTFHPAFLLHQESLTNKRLVWEDMLQVMEKLGQPITDKQRGYFLRGS